MTKLSLTFRPSIPMKVWALRLVFRWLLGSSPRLSMLPSSNSKVHDVRSPYAWPRPIFHFPSTVLTSYPSQSSYTRSNHPQLR